ncbi:Acetylcholine receptor subunit alpha-type acr-16 [Fasciolopsis buskii]|uniref:Acetylcholine receptor subunit alpha-type acr-16 n=1 Tax=Fasciolopsis buskii TaxID=27845 RepID=A0A8E0RKH3_9TREM|nr:Acetylcholine receptor subunit alpha-type acr-16 [Fasciolopsis buski]
MNVDFTLASFLLTVLLVCNAKQWTVRERVHYLLAGYDSIGRPVQNATTPIQALIDVVLQQVVDLDEKNQVLVTSLLIQLKWRDEILSHKLQILRALIRRDWQPTDQTDSNGGGNLFDVDEISFVLPSDRIWTPDLYVYNNAADGNKGMLRVEESRLRVSECGEVTWNLPVTVQSLCNVDVLYFPFDHQICDVRIGSWMYDKAQFELHLASRSNDSKAMLNGIMENVELGIPEAKLFVQERITVDRMKFSQVTLRIHIKRRALFYGYTVIAPSILLCVLTIFSFWLPSGNAKKIDIGLTVFLFLYFLQVLIAENTPESNSTPLIGSFLTVVMTLNSLSLISATWVLYVHVQSKQDPCPAPPRLLWTMASRVMGPVTRTMYGQAQEKLYIQLHANRDVLNKTAEQDSNIASLTNAKDQSNIHVVHWLYIATVADRLLFQIYLFATLICIFIFLIYAPISYDVKI